ncbi:spore coat protein [Geobacillus sp. G4]|uniref:Spore coat protein n=6 Tax=Geobacillus TaxID=129337 RepID=Q5KZT3_GEOKA|nr:MULTISPECIES: spore coat protein [Geobacillus]KDE48037.1 spore gernimation protein GerQ [Geobacillus sp. CAMR12739]AEV19064.1 Spore coat protein-like protein [Geobacillus thermoleovorans CCB_US3_UF5]AOL34385.1 spore gernimation protein GerQ [Geobacillus thermoleovorans]AUI35542.1 spore coat protein [[Bacillus] caldolyticus]AWO76232.1 spore coat protein [Geobacillus thermoleovorans]
MQATMTPTGVLNDQMIAADCLISAKNAIKGCAMAIAEASTPEVRNTLKQHLNDAITFHEQISQYMVNKGYYHPTNVQEQLRLDLQAAQQVLSRYNQNV